MASAEDTSAVIERIEARASDFEGTLGVAARRLGGGNGDAIFYNADVVFPTASTMKEVFLYELLRQVDSGKVSLEQRVTFEDRHRVPGSGVLQDLDAGTSLTVKDLATLMIVLSDNTATDMVYDLVGRAEVAGAIASLGMPHTYLPIDTWEILAGLHNLDPHDPALTYERLKESLSASPSPDGNAALAETPANNISTPRDFLRLNEAIAAGEGLSAGARDGVLDILLRQKLNSRIPEQLPFGTRVAHKTGSVRGVANDIGVVYAGEVTYAIALMSKGSPSSVASDRTLSDVSKLIYEAFVGPVTDTP